MGKAGQCRQLRTIDTVTCGYYHVIGRNHEMILHLALDGLPGMEVLPPHSHGRSEIQHQNTDFHKEPERIFE